MVNNERGLRRLRSTEGGFTLIEFMIAALITTAVLSGTVMLASQLQQAYTTQLDDALVEEEARFTLDWIEQALRNAGSNPYSIGGASGLALSCAGAGGFRGIDIDGDWDGDSVTTDDIRIHADINPPNGLIGGAFGVCDEQNEDVTIAFDDANLVITREDNSVDAAPVVMTEPVITAVQFAYFLADGVTATTNENLVSYIRVRVTGKSAPKQNLYDADDAFTTTTLETMVHIRTR